MTSGNAFVMPVISQVVNALIWNCLLFKKKTPEIKKCTFIVRRFSNFLALMVNPRIMITSVIIPKFILKENILLDPKINDL